MKKIVILHGWSYSTDKWNAFIEFFKTKKIPVIFLSIPGLTEKTTKVWSLNDYVEWLDERLKDEKGEIILIGHSNGGRIAISYVAKHPGKILHLVLIDSAGIYHNEIPLRLKRFVFKTIATLGKKITTSQTMKNILYKVARERDYKDATPEMKQTMINLISQDLTSELKQVNTPTLIIWGREDKSTPLEDGIKMKNYIKNSELYIVDKARHSPQFTNTENVCEKIANELHI